MAESPGAVRRFDDDQGFSTVSALKEAFASLDPRARQAVVEAEREARALGHPWVGTGHLLAGVLKHHSTIDIGYEQVHALLVHALGNRGPGPAGRVQLTLGVAKAVAAASVIRRVRHDKHIGTTHLLVALAHPKAPDSRADDDAAAYDIAQRLLSEAVGSVERFHFAVRAML